MKAKNNWYGNLKIINRLQFYPHAQYYIPV